MIPSTGHLDQPGPTRTVVGRLAPSPTGGLHVGHARTFLVAWLAARSVGGRVVLRIEDIDASRVRPEAIAASIADLRWLGLDWDEGPDLGGPHGPYLQSERIAKYDEALARLKAAELVYPCTCTRADVARAASAPHPGDDGPAYPGTCSGRSAGDAETLTVRPYSWRFRVSQERIFWDDLIQGPISGAPFRSVGDFLVGRSSGEPSYQLAVVCDDWAMGVNQVIRGDDLVSSTPRQIALDRALGWPVPAFGHVPLVLGDDGRRLAKRDGSIKLASFRERRETSRRLIGVLAKSLGLSDHGVPSSPADWIGRMDLARIPKDPWIALGTSS